MQSYTYTRHLPKILTEDELGLIHQTILNSDGYHHNKVGEFLKWRDITAIECCVAQLILFHNNINFLSQILFRN